MMLVHAITCGSENGGSLSSEIEIREEIDPKFVREEVTYGKQASKTYPQTLISSNTGTSCSMLASTSAVFAFRKELEAKKFYCEKTESQ